MKPVLIIAAAAWAAFTATLLVNVAWRLQAIHHELWLGNCLALAVHGVRCPEEQGQ